MKKLLLGNEAVARGLYEAGVTVVSSYPGTPSTEITEAAAKYDDIYCEWAPNEKVAAETAIGASLAGARSFCGMKHVGLNVAADPVFTASYTGVNGGLIICVADDPGMHSSQNEQDSRNYAIGSKLPMLEPSDSSECLKFTKLAYEISEKYDTPVMLRLCTRVSHSRSVTALSGREDRQLSEYIRDPGKRVMLPANAKKRHPIVEQRTLDLISYAETAEINKVEYADSEIGIITSGISYCYAKEAFGDSVSYLKLGMVNPLPSDLIKIFAQKHKKVFVIEELDPVIEKHCRAIGVNVIGKELFPSCGEFSQALLRKLVAGVTPDTMSFDEPISPRPPAMCCGCPHRSLFFVLKKLGAYVSGDIGCYTLGAAAPFSALDTCVCMGSSVSMLHGFNKARGSEYEKKAVAVIGDSTFIHSGVNSLINVAYNRSNSVTIILDNSITGMTGHQQNPTTGYTIKGDPTSAVSLENLAVAIGIDNVAVVDPYNMKETEKVIRAALDADEPAVVISRRPCALLKYVKHNPPLSIDKDKCKGCKLCMKLGCPAISFKDSRASVDSTQCVGCGVCAQLCSFGAICGGDDNE